MDKGNIERIFRELGVPRRVTDEAGAIREALRAQDLRDLLGRIDAAALEDIPQGDLELVYNAFFRGEEDLIPAFGPYNVPSEAMIAAMRSGKPLDLEDYRDENIPDGAVF